MKQAKQSIQLTDSTTLAKAKRRFLFHAPPGNRKTTTAATASEFHPENGGDGVLKDMVWVTFNPTELDGFPALGLNAPFVYDLSALSGAELMNGVKDVCLQIVENSKEWKWLVWDNLTSLDRKFKLTYDDLRDNNNTYYSAINNTWMRWWALVNALPIHQMLLCHSKGAFQQASKDNETAAAQQAARVAKSGPGTDAIEMNITGQARQMFQGEVSLYCTIGHEGPKANRVYSIYPGGHKGFESKNKWETVLDKKEPANIHKLLEKIDG